MAVALVAGCGPKQQPDRLRPDELSTRNGPVFVTRHDGATCSTIYAIDGDGQGWYEEDCPAPVVLRRSNQAAPSDRSQLEADFKLLPNPDPCTAASSKDSNGNVVTLSRRDVLGETIWIGCTAPDPSGIPRISEPYARADALLAKMAKP
jgi:hypothetical protein